jgi:hypothetical protein
MDVAGQSPEPAFAEAGPQQETEAHHHHADDH